MAAIAREVLKRRHPGAKVWTTVVRDEGPRAQRIVTVEGADRSTCERVNAQARELLDELYGDPNVRAVECDRGRLADWHY